MPDQVYIGEKLKKLREENGMTQEELAKATGVDRSTIGMYETGKRIPKDSTKIQLARVFQQTVESLFFME